MDAVFRRSAQYVTMDCLILGMSINAEVGVI